MTPEGAPRTPFAGEVAVGDHRLHAELVGGSNQPLVVLLHSGLGSTADWRRLAPALQRGGYQTLAYDRQGHGKAGARSAPAPPPFDDEVGELAGLLDAMGASEAALVGHSDGGTIALLFAAKYPRRTTCVVAVAAHVCVELKTRHGIASFARQARRDERFMAAMTRRHGDKAADLLDAWTNAWLRPEALAWDVRPEIAGECPSLIVQGLNDEYATEDHARDITAWVTGAELWLEPGVDHLLPQAIPDEFNKRTLDFLARHCAEPT